MDAIFNRRSIRKYKDQPVEREKLETLIRCGINAPSGMNRQPWEVRVVDDAEYGVRTAHVETDDVGFFYCFHRDDVFYGLFNSWFR